MFHYQQEANRKEEKRRKGGRENLNAKHADT